MRLSKRPFLQVISWCDVWAFRSIPLVVQLLFWFTIAYLYHTLQFGVRFGPALFTVTTNDLFGPLGQCSRSADHAAGVVAGDRCSGAVAGNGNGAAG